MSTTLYDWLKENTDFYPGQGGEDFDAKIIQDEFGYDFPQDYYELMQQTNGCEFGGEHNNINLFDVNEVTNMHTDPGYMVPLCGMAIIGADGGGNLYYYDAKNKMGRGEFAIYWISRSVLSLNGSKYLAKNLTELALLIKNADRDFFNFPDMKEEGFDVKENPPVPKATVNNLKELLGALPNEINAERYGRGVLEIKESTKANGSPHISGQYNLDNDMCLFYTFSSTYQGFYDAIAPALTMEGLLKK